MHRVGRAEVLLLWGNSTGTEDTHHERHHHHRGQVGRHPVRTRELHLLVLQQRGGQRHGDITVPGRAAALRHTQDPQTNTVI